MYNAIFQSNQMAKKIWRLIRIECKQTNKNAYQTIWHSSICFVMMCNLKGFGRRSVHFRKQNDNSLFVWFGLVVIFVNELPVIIQFTAAFLQLIVRMFAHRPQVFASRVGGSFISHFTFYTSFSLNQMQCSFALSVQVVKKREKNKRRHIYAFLISI